MTGVVHAQAPVLRQQVDGSSTPAAADSERKPRAKDGMYAVVATVAAGYTHYVNPYVTQIDINREGVAVSGRILWHPDNRLRIGLESGWTRFYSYNLVDVETSFGRTDASLSLSAVPMLLVFAMPVYGDFTIYGGTGGYLVHSRAESFGVTVDVDRFSQGWMAAAGWDAQTGSRYRLGVELKWYGATEFGDGVVALQMKMDFTLLDW